MEEPIVIIIGAGAAGLQAARDLSAAGKKTMLLEADNAPGGRIHTLQPDGFSVPIEAGAEFIHGDLPLTLQLLKEAGINYHPVEGKMVRVQKGQRVGQGAFTEDWGQLMEKMKELEDSGKDMPIGDFLASRFPEEKYTALRQSAQRFAEGYDLADMHTASTLTLYTEWNEEDHVQYRIAGGYGRLVDFLLEECRRHGCSIHLSSPVKKISWQKDRVTVMTAAGETFSGNKAVIAVPLGILKLATDPLPAAGAIEFSPSLPRQMEAARQLGYGSVTKILLEFREPFWNKWDEKTGFILSDEEIPTWWAQTDKSTILTGWVTGSARVALAEMDETQQLHHCLSSLAGIFSIDVSSLRQQLVASRIYDWAARSFVKGGYSFDTVETPHARKILRQPVEHTLYFAGEALYEGIVPGTVEAALVTGKEVADSIREEIR